MLEAGHVLLVSEGGNKFSIGVNHESPFDTCLRRLDVRGHGCTFTHNRPSRVR